MKHNVINESYKAIPKDSISKFYNVYNPNDNFLSNKIVYR